MIINFKHFGPINIYTPAKRPDDSGFDLQYIGSDNVILSPGQIKKFRTGIGVEIPSGFGGQLYGRSGLATEGIVVLGGVIDASYRGEIIAILGNVGESAKVIKFGDRICQLVVMPVAHGEFMCYGELSPSTRGEQGLGSSGR